MIYIGWMNNLVISFHILGKSDIKDTGILATTRYIENDSYQF